MQVSCTKCGTLTAVSLPPGMTGGTVFIGRVLCPSCEEIEQALIAARPRYAEKRANQLIGEWQSSGEVTIQQLRDLIIELIEEDE